MKEHLRVAFLFDFLELTICDVFYCIFSIYYYILLYYIICMYNNPTCHPQGSPTQSLKILASSLVIYGPGSWAWAMVGPVEPPWDPPGGAQNFFGVALVALGPSFFGYDLTQYKKKHSYHTYTYINIYIYTYIYILIL